MVFRVVRVHYVVSLVATFLLLVAVVRLALLFRRRFVKFVKQRVVRRLVFKTRENGLQVVRNVRQPFGKVASRGGSVYVVFARVTFDLPFAVRVTREQLKRRYEPVVLPLALVVAVRVVRYILKVKRREFILHQHVSANIML